MKNRAGSYALALAALVAAVLLRQLLVPVMGNTLPLVTVFGAVAAAVWLGGLLPAILVTIAGYLACNYLFIGPRGAINLSSAEDLVGLAAYLFTCSLIIGFGEALRAAQRRANEEREVLR